MAFVSALAALALIQGFCGRKNSKPINNDDDGESDVESDVESGDEMDVGTIAVSGDRKGGISKHISSRAQRRNQIPDVWQTSRMEVRRTGPYP